MNTDFVSTDTELRDVLRQATEDEAALLITVLRRAPIRCSLSPDCRGIDAIVDAFQRLGGNAIANLFRRHGIWYKEIVSDVGKKLKANIPQDASTEDAEWVIACWVVRQFWERVPEDSRPLLDLPHDNRRLNAEAKLKILNLALTDIAQWSLRSSFLGPSYKAIIPAVLIIAKIRVAASQRSEHTRPEPTHHIRLSENVVEAWALYHVAFENNGPEQQRLKEDLQRTLHKLDEVQRAATLAMHALYESPDAVRSDTENLLFYNMGIWESISPHRPALRFERLYRTPRPCPVSLAREPRHYYQYRLEDLDSGLSYWKPRESFLLDDTFAVESIAALKSDTPGLLWLEITRKMTAPQAEEHGTADGPYRGRYGIMISISIFSSSGSFRIKTIIDGVVSAMHRYSGPDLDEVVTRLARRLEVSEEEIRNLLLSPKNKVLGDHPMVKPWGTGVQFSPKDDLCDAAAVTLDTTTGQPGIAIRVQVFEIMDAPCGSDATP